MADPPASSQPGTCEAGANADPPRLHQTHGPNVRNPNITSLSTSSSSGSSSGSGGGSVSRKSTDNSCSDSTGSDSAAVAPRSKRGLLPAPALAAGVACLSVGTLPLCRALLRSCGPPALLSLTASVFRQPPTGQGAAAPAARILVPRSAAIAPEAAAASAELLAAAAAAAAAADEGGDGGGGSQAGGASVPPHPPLLLARLASLVWPLVLLGLLQPALHRLKKRQQRQQQQGQQEQQHVRQQEQQDVGRGPSTSAAGVTSLRAPLPPRRRAGGGLWRLVRRAFRTAALAHSAAVGGAVTCGALRGPATAACVALEAAARAAALAIHRAVAVAALAAAWAESQAMDGLPLPVSLPLAACCAALCHQLGNAAASAALGTVPAPAPQRTLAHPTSVPVMMSPSGPRTDPDAAAIGHASGPRHAGASGPYAGFGAAAADGVIRWTLSQLLPACAEPGLRDDGGLRQGERGALSAAVAGGILAAVLQAAVMGAVAVLAGRLAARRQKAGCDGGWALGHWLPHHPWLPHRVPPPPSSPHTGAEVTAAPTDPAACDRRVHDGDNSRDNSGGGGGGGCSGGGGGCPSLPAGGSPPPHAAPHTHTQAHTLALALLDLQKAAVVAAASRSAPSPRDCLYTAAATRRAARGRGGGGQLASPLLAPSPLLAVGKWWGGAGAHVGITGRPQAGERSPRASSNDHGCGSHGGGSGGGGGGGGGGDAARGVAAPGRKAAPQGERERLPTASVEENGHGDGGSGGDSRHGGAAAAAALAGPVAPRQSALYRSPLAHIGITFKLEGPLNVPFDQVATQLTAAAHRTVAAVLAKCGDREPEGGEFAATAHPSTSTSTFASAGAAGAAPGGAAAADDPPHAPFASGSQPPAAAAPDPPAGRWLGYATRVHCLRGCIELVVEIPYEDEQPPDAEVAGVVEDLEAELVRRAAALGFGGPATAAAAGGETAAPSGGEGAEGERAAAAGGAAEAAENATARSAVLIPPVWLLHHPPAAAPAPHVPPLTGRVARAVPILAYMDPPVIAVGGRPPLSAPASPEPPPADPEGAQSQEAEAEAEAGEGEERWAATGATPGGGDGDTQSGGRRSEVQVELFLDWMHSPPAGRQGGAAAQAWRGVNGEAGAAAAVRRHSGGAAEGGSDTDAAAVGAPLADGGGGDGAGGTSAAAAAAAAPFADVRVVVEQRGSVVAEVERLRVGPLGANTSLDVSALVEGGAALLVLPLRQPHTVHAAATTTAEPATEAAAAAPGPELAPAGAAQPQPGRNPPAAGTGSGGRPGPYGLPAMLCASVLAAPADVASELAGLMQRMEAEVATGGGDGDGNAAGAGSGGAGADYAAGGDGDGGPPTPTDPRVTRALAFTRHFSALISDMVSLLAGCERVGAEYAALAPAGAVEHSGGGGGGAGGAECAGGAGAEGSVGGGAEGAGGGGEVPRLAELRRLAGWLVSFLEVNGMEATRAYLVRRIRATGVRILGEDAEAQHEEQLPTPSTDSTGSDTDIGLGVDADVDVNVDVGGPAVNPPAPSRNGGQEGQIGGEGNSRDDKGKGQGGACGVDGATQGAAAVSAATGAERGEEASDPAGASRPESAGTAAATAEEGQSQPQSQRDQGQRTSATAAGGDRGGRAGGGSTAGGGSGGDGDSGLRRREGRGRQGDEPYGALEACGPEATVSRPALRGVLRSVLLGFRDPEDERKCTEYRVRAANSLNVPTAAFNSAMALLAVTSLLLSTTTSGGGGGGGDGGGGGGGGAAAAAPVPPPAPWALTQLALALCTLVVPALLFCAHSGIGTSPRYRDVCVRLSHLGCLLAFYLYVSYANATSTLLLTGRTLAAMIVVVHPASYSVCARTGLCCWLVDTVLLTLIYRSVAARTASASGGLAAAAGAAPWLPPAAAAAGCVFASALLLCAVDLHWRLRYLQNLHAEGRAA